MKAFRRILHDLWEETSGQDLIEYSLLLGFFAVTSIAFLHSTWTSANAVWSRIVSALSSAVSAS
jgi:Flp pilus assembly pilin Flp